MAITITGYTTQLPTRAADTNGSAGVAARNREQSSADAELVVADKVSLGKGATETSLTYGDPRAVEGREAEQKVDLQAMLEESDRKAQEIISLIMSMVNKQGASLSKIISGEVTLEADAETVAEARAAIAEDGEWGVNQTAERILDFARNAIGHDASRLEAIRAAVERGFDDAMEMLGGTLPEISQATHAKVMAEFDRWRNEGLGEAVQTTTENG